MNFYNLLRKLPVVGSVFRIVNAYVYQGDVDCLILPT